MAVTQTMSCKRLSLHMLWLGLVFLLAVFYSCKKNQPIADSSAKLSFTTDTLTFDTVFTTIGSATRLFKIKNPHRQPIIITSAKLAGGNQSPFRMNIDGLPGTAFSDLEIAAQDSMYVFVEVTVDPTQADLPFVIYDSVEFMTNGNRQTVTLEAYGQNAHFFRNEEICNQNWIDDKPYVLLGSVLIDTGCTLTIGEGCRIYAHNQANLFVAGKLDIQGSPDSLVRFEGDRLEHFFDDLPGQWGSIVFLRGSTGNSIKGAEIREATTGIVLGSMSSADVNDFTAANKPDLNITQTTISQCSQWGIFSFFSDVSASNVLIHSVGDNDVALLYGGTHEFTHCTLANFGATGLDHKSPILRMTNFAVQNSTAFVAPFDAKFVNSIIYGNILTGEDEADGELNIEMVESPTLDTLFQNCIIKTNNNLAPANFVNVFKNINPHFLEIGEDNYALEGGSPGINAGILTSINVDLFGTPRDAQPDIGAIEKE